MTILEVYDRLEEIDPEKAEAYLDKTNYLRRYVMPRKKVTVEDLNEALWKLFMMILQWLWLLILVK